MACTHLNWPYLDLAASHALSVSFGRARTSSHLPVDQNLIAYTMGLQSTYVVNALAPLPHSAKALTNSKHIPMNQ